MKKFSFRLITAAAFFLGGLHLASATTDFTWLCKIKGELQGYNRGLVVSYGVLEGSADITCHSPLSALRGEVVKKSVVISIKSLGLGLDWNDVDKATIFSSSIGIENLNDMMGTYSISASAGASFLVGGVEVTPFTAVHGSNSGFGIDLTIMGQKISGLGGFHIRFNKMTIEENGEEDEGDREEVGTP